MDAQGWSRARPFVDRAGVTFRATVDREGVLWERFGFNFVPLQLYFDETGRLVYRSRGAPEGEVLERLDEALAAPRADGAPAGGAAAMPTGEARRLFARGVAALDEGDRAGALAAWRQALELDPENWLIRKQIWALDAPERFYEGEIDWAWQRRRLAAEKPE